MSGPEQERERYDRRRRARDEQVMSPRHFFSAAGKRGLKKKGGSPLRLAGQTGHVFRTLEVVDGAVGSACRWRLTAVHAQPIAISATSQFGANLVVRLLQGADICCGDDSLDDKLLIRGDEAAILARLRPKARRLLDSLIRAGGGVYEGEVLWVSPEAEPMSEALLKRLDRLTSLARYLKANPYSRGSNLARNMVEDPLPGVRLRNLQVCLARYPSEVEARRATLARDRGLMELTEGRHAERAREVLSQLLIQGWLKPANLPRSTAITLLDGAPSALQTVLIAELGRNGDQATAVKLTPYAAGVFRSRAVKAAARAAIEAITEREGELLVGQLTLTASESVPSEGALSEADQKA